MNLSRPNFFPGQLIDFKDFNRLAAQPERLLSFLCQHLFEGGGLVVNALSEFALEVGNELKVHIKPGVAVLPSGAVAWLDEERIVDLAPYRGRENSEVMVCIRTQLQGTERYVDREDSTICGYQSETHLPDIQVSSPGSTVGAIELFRVRLAAKTSTLRLASREEEWDPTLGLGVIDQRNRKRIIPQTYAPLSGTELLKIRAAFYQIERAHRKLQYIYLVEDPFTTAQYLSQLHAELLNQPLQPLKVAFLIAEFAEKLSLFLERLMKHAGKQRSNFSRDLLLESVGLIESLRIREVIPRQIAWQTLLDLADRLHGLVDYAESKFNLLTTVEEALVDVRDREFTFDDRIVLAGHLFERVDLISADSDRYEVKAPHASTRMLSTRYRNGDVNSRLGCFFKDGLINLPLKVPHSDRPLVILLHQYIRRSGTTLHYELNGKAVMTDLVDYPDLANSWINRGMVVSQETLVPQANRLTIRVEQSDLDFGFFDLAVYQPSLLREVSNLEARGK